MSVLVISISKVIHHPAVVVIRRYAHITHWLAIIHECTNEATLFGIELSLCLQLLYLAYCEIGYKLPFVL